MLFVDLGIFMQVSIQTFALSCRSGEHKHARKHEPFCVRARSFVLIAMRYYTAIRHWIGGALECAVCGFIVMLITTHRTLDSSDVARIEMNIFACIFCAVFLPVCACYLDDFLKSISLLFSHLLTYFNLLLIPTFIFKFQMLL